jgi:DNA repair exonuclease SbcCD nuclease subunit
VAAILVAGDVFDAQALADRTLRKLFAAMESFAGPWIVIPGNHDAALADGAWRRAAQMNMIPANVTAIFEARTVAFESLGFAVLAAPLTQRHTFSDLTQWFDTAPTDPGLARIGLAHGAVKELLPSEVDSPNPIAADRAARARLDYLALGDWHGTFRVDDRTWYSGTPEPDRFKANDSGNVLIVDVNAGTIPSVQSVRTARHQWHELDFNLGLPTDVDALLARLSELASADVVSVEVSGRTDLQGMKRIAEALGRVEAAVRAYRGSRDRLRLAPTDADVAELQADGYVGEVLEELRARQDQDAEGVAALALRLLAETLLDQRQAAR